MTAHPCRRAGVVKPVADPDDEVLIGPPLGSGGGGMEDGGRRRNSLEDALLLST